MYAARIAYGNQVALAQWGDDRWDDIAPNKILYYIANGP